MAEFGWLSAKYESDGDAGTISSGWGDPGGKSYGIYQLSSNAGSLEEYVDWLQENEYWFGAELAKHELTSAEFDAAWRWLAYSDNGHDFKESQDRYAMSIYYNPAVRYLRGAGFNIENHHDIMKEVVFSRAIQYGPGQIVDMFTDAVHYLGWPDLSYVDAERFDYDMVMNIYLKVCSSWEWNHSASRDSLNYRFMHECRDVLDVLEAEA
jgi:hypothetical protein